MKVVYHGLFVGASLLLLVDGRNPGSERQDNQAERGLIQRVELLEKSQKSQIGIILPSGGGPCPENFLVCDGRELDPKRWQDLFQAIGYAWGKGKGANFKIPDLRSEFLRGADDMETELGPRNVEDNKGRKVASTQSHAFQVHTIKGSGSAQGVIAAPGSVGILLPADVKNRINAFYSSSTHLPNDPKGQDPSNYARVIVTGEVASGSTAPETRPMNRAVNFWIKAK